MTTPNVPRGTVGGTVVRSRVVPRGTILVESWASRERKRPEFVLHPSGHSRSRLASETDCHEEGTS